MSERMEVKRACIWDVRWEMSLAMKGGRGGVRVRVLWVVHELQFQAEAGGEVTFA